MSYRLSEQAIMDVDLIHLYGVQAFGVRQANRYQNELFETFARLAEFPLIGPIYSENMRRFSYWPYVILYSHDELDGLVIQTIIHGRQDWKDLGEG